MHVREASGLSIHPEGFARPLFGGMHFASVSFLSRLRGCSVQPSSGGLLLIALSLVLFRWV